jgi:spore coat protein A, manganese oxidase
MVTRREFLKYAGIAGAAATLPLKFGVKSAHAAFINSPNLDLWSTQLRIVGPAGIPVAAPDATPAPTTNVTHYTINIGEFTDQICPSQDHVGNLIGPTKLWGYHPVYPLGGPQTSSHLGGIIVVDNTTRVTPIQITFNNNLPPTHILPNDLTVPGANSGANRTAVHLHGGFVPWISDGGPFDYWGPGGVKGASFINNAVLNSAAASNQAEYYYPNQQSARLMWYHDHAWGITRLNAYAGIASAYIIRDAFEKGLIDGTGGVAQGLPPFIETSVLSGGTMPIQELPIVIQDKVFQPASVLTFDPTWTGAVGAGYLWYAHTYDPKLFKLQGNKKGKNAITDPSAVPEFFGDTMLANGTVYPEVVVEPRRYRLRILNACNARFLNLQLYVDDGFTKNGITLNAAGAPTNAKGPDFLVIGTEGGFLPKPVLVPSNVPFNPLTLGGSLITGNAERWDVIVDFTANANQKIILYSDTPGPFPVGAPTNDYFPGLVNGNPVNALTPAGAGPNTRCIMRFKVGTSVTGSDLPLTISPATNLAPFNDPLFVTPGATVDATGNTVLPAGAAKKVLTLNENFDIYGRLQQLLGTNAPLGTAGAGFGRAYLDPATETPTLNALEVWEVCNLTADTHPIHFHIVDVQILSRRPFRTTNFGGVPAYLGPAVLPLPYEQGWKETVRMNPGEATTVAMQFKLPVMPISIPPSTRTMGGTVAAPVPIPNANEYVWHCHILEHEEHDMMRPLVVVGTNPVSTLAATIAPGSISGSSGGSATITVSGGTAPYSVASSNPLLPATPVTAGVYQVTVSVGTSAGSVTYTVVDALGIVRLVTLTIA